MSSRKEQKERLRAEREAQERAARESAASRRRIGYVAAGALVAAALIAIVVVLLSGGDSGGGPEAGGGSGDFPDGSVPAPRESDIGTAVRAAGCRLRDFRNEGANHVEGAVRYRTNPPTSGDHFQIPAEDGAYTEAPRTEQLVHSLEHGRILIQFKPTASDELKGSLKALFDEDPAHVILTPNETRMPYEVAATAWTHLLGCPRPNDRVYDAIRAFKDRYRDRGPEFVP